MLDKCVVYVLKLAECNVVSLAYDTSKLSSWERVPHAPLRETRKNALSSSSLALGRAVLNQYTYAVLTKTIFVLVVQKYNEKCMWKERI